MTQTGREEIKSVLNWSGVSGIVVGHCTAATKWRFPMDESSVTSANLDQADQDFFAHEIPDEIVEAAAQALNTCRLTFGGWPSTTVACCNPG